MKDDKEIRSPDASELQAMRSIYCALDMLHDDVCTPHTRLPQTVLTILMNAKDPGGIKEDVARYVEGLIVLSEEFRGMTVNLMRRLSQAAGTPFESSTSVEEALDSRKSFEQRMGQTNIETGDVEQLLNVVRAMVEKAVKGEGGGNY